MVFYDFVEVGTDDFDAEIQEADDEDVGLFINPFQFYLDRIPHKARCQKYQALVSNRSEQIQVFYINPTKIEEHLLNDHLLGCNTIGRPHPEAMKEIQDLGLNPEDLLVSEMVPLVTFDQLIEKFNISGLYYLKIHTEDQNQVVLHNYCDSIGSKPYLKAHLIKFASSQLTSRTHLTKILQRLFSLGYELVTSGDYTEVRLPFQAMHQRVGAPFLRYYIEGYPEDYDPVNKPHQETLASAMAYARQIGAGGVTYEDGLYSVRAPTRLIHYRNPGLKSWVIGGENNRSSINYGQHNWTLVSAFYDLNRYHSIQSENQDSFNDKATVFDLDVALVFFCDPTMYDHYYALCKRRNRLETTVIIPISFEDYFMFRYIDTIQEVRLGNSFYCNSNTPAHSCLIMSKMEMMSKAAKLNPFRSRMMGWIDYSYVPSDYLNEYNIHLKEIVDLAPDAFPPDKYVIGLVDWVTGRLSYQPNQFHKYVTTTFCAGFHFGNISTIESTHAMMREVSVRMIEDGWGYYEEQIFFFTFLEHRDNFAYFPTDHRMDIFNVIYPLRNLYITYGSLLPHLMACYEYEMAYNIVQMIYKSQEAGKITLNPFQAEICQQVTDKRDQQMAEINKALGLDTNSIIELQTSDE